MELEAKHPQRESSLTVVYAGWLLHYGILVIMVPMEGAITPPMGLQSFIAFKIGGMWMVDADVWPFVAAIYALIVLIMFFLVISTYLPGLLF